MLVATFYGEHEQHALSFELFLGQKKQTGFTAAHCLAEVYAVLTGMPGKDRASPDEALLFLSDVRERLTLVALTNEEYVAALEENAAAGIRGGSIYDALIGRCAMKAKAEAIYTWNVKHFTRLSADFAARVKTP
ncbi:MAG: PIN domain-containing protein [Acidobacteriota bacterium]|nr:PIN domain-containing protein [Acidobacteriota bacterium]